jgi:hypothetical protein
VTAEFWGLDNYADPGPKPFIPARVPRKAYYQQGSDTCSPSFDRSSMMADLTRRAMEFFGTLQGVDWKTVEFRIVNHGTEPPGTELWRWEVWIIG